MTIAQYIHGRSEGLEEIDFSFIPYDRLTDGELAVVLAAKQAKALYAGTGDKSYIDSVAMLAGAFEAGISGKDITPGNKALLKWAKQSIRERNYPAVIASDVAGSTQIGQFGFDEVRRKRVDECKRLLVEWTQTGFWSLKKRAELKAKYEACFDAVKYLDVVNERLGESGAHLLFSFDSQKSTESIRRKRLLHRIAIENYSTVFGLSEANILAWIRAGIIEEMTKTKGKMAQPEEIINEAIHYNKAGVGALPAAIAVVKSILEIAVIAIAAVSAILSAMGQSDYIKATANTQGLGTRNFGPMENDFLSDVKQSGAIWPILAAAGILIFRK